MSSGNLASYACQLLYLIWKSKPSGNNKTINFVLFFSPYFSPVFEVEQPSIFVHFLSITPSLDLVIQWTLQPMITQCGYFGSRAFNVPVFLFRPVCSVGLPGAWLPIIPVYTSSQTPTAGRWVTWGRNQGVATRPEGWCPNDGRPPHPKPWVTHQLFLAPKDPHCLQPPGRHWKQWQRHCIWKNGHIKWFHHKSHWGRCRAQQNRQLCLWLEGCQFKSQRPQCDFTAE